MLFDTHCHLDFSDFDTDRQDVLKRAKDAGVNYILDVGSCLKSSQKAVSLSNEYSNIYASVGIHPHDAKNFSDEAMDSLTKLAKEKKVIAIGEVGLDYYRNLSQPNIQQKVFIKFILLAKEYNLPIIIHTRQAQPQMLGILSEYLRPPIEGVMHCFSGDENFLKDVLDLGLYVSFTCNVTFKNATRLKGLVKLVPPDRLLLETDAPFLAPQALRGRRNEPAYLVYLVKELALILGIPEETISKTTTDNAKRLFRIHE